MGTADAHCHIVNDTPYIKRETVVVTMTNGSRCHRHQIDLSYTHSHTLTDTHTYVHSHTHKRQAQLQTKEPPYKTRSIFKLDIMIPFEDDLCLKICSTHTYAHTHTRTCTYTDCCSVCRRLLLLAKQGSSPLVTLRRAPPRKQLQCL